MTFLERYQAGEHVAVWDEMMALGEGIRHELYLKDAQAVATETMRRVRRNVELLIPRLAEAGYRFVPPSDESSMDMDQIMGQIAGQLGGSRLAGADVGSIVQQAKQKLNAQFPGLSDKMANRRAEQAARVASILTTPPLENRTVFDPPGKQTAAQIRKLEKAAGGPLPLSLRAYYEEVGGVSLMGSHPVLNPLEQGPGDPLVVAPIEEMLQMIESFGMEGDDELGLWIAPDDFHKANVSGGEPYTIKIPDPKADGPFLYEFHNTTFVKYLRIAFQWGGFPGWDHEKRKLRATPLRN